MMKYTFFLLAILFFGSGCDLSGNKPLGSGFAFSLGDKTEDQKIIYCLTSNCTTGLIVIPKYSEKPYSNEDYTEYVVDAKSNKHWIIAKTHQIKPKKDNYWLLNKDFAANYIECATSNCDSLIQAHVIGLLNSRSI